MASGMDQNRIVDFLQAATGQSANASTPFTAILLNPFSASASQLGHVRLMTTTGSSTSNGLELSGGSYVSGTGITYSTGPSGTFGAAAYSAGQGTIQTASTLSQAGMPTATIHGVEIWDSAATPLRWWWGDLTSAVTTASGNTLSFGSGAIVAFLTA